MVKPKKSWLEKLRGSKDFPKIITPKVKNAGQYGNQMVVLSPLEVDVMMKNV